MPIYNQKKPFVDWHKTVPAGNKYPYDSNQLYIKASMSKKVAQPYKKYFIATLLNPKNWGVKDYTDKGSRSAAYAAAKKAGEKEFIWNNKRFNTDYAGTVQEEVKSYFPEYNVITGVEPGDYFNTALSKINKSKNHKWPHAFTGDLNKKTVIDYPSGYNYSQFGIDAYDDTKYYASKINTDSNYDKLSKMNENMNAGEYDVINNNCAGAVCAGLDLPYGKLPLPSRVPMKLKLKYPTIELTSNMTDAKELDNLYTYLDSDNEDSLLNTSINTLEKYSGHKSLIKGLQDILFKKGYKLPKSTKEDGTFDGIWGDETENALLDYQAKKKNK